MTMKILPIFLLVIVWAPSRSLQNHYCSINSEHTLCKYQGLGARCKLTFERGMPAVDRNLIMSMHNGFRSLIATGSEHRGRPGPQPQAANMRQMEWDDELATSAQRLADQCKYAHDCLQCRKVDRFFVGQNLYQFSENILRDSSNWRQAIMAWYDEVADFNPSSVDRFSFVKELGHYTQMVWADTYKIGCGYMYYNEGKWNRKIYICNYGPAGNIITTPMYKRGIPCSQCPQGTTCSSQYSGLCTTGSSKNNFFTNANTFVKTTRPPVPTVPQTTHRIKYTKPTTTTTTTTTTRPTTRRTTTTTTESPYIQPIQQIDFNEIGNELGDRIGGSSFSQNRFNYTTYTFGNGPIVFQEEKITTRRPITTTSRPYRRRTTVKSIQTTRRPFGRFTTPRITSRQTTQRITNPFESFKIRNPTTNTFFTTNYPITTTSTTTTTTTTTTKAPTTKSTTTAKPISFSPQIYPNRKIIKNARVPPRPLPTLSTSKPKIFKSQNIEENAIQATSIINTNSNRPSVLANTNTNRFSKPKPTSAPTTTSNRNKFSQYTDKKVYRTSESIVNSQDTEDIQLYCDFDYSKCPIRFTGAGQWNYTLRETPGFGRGFETIVQPKTQSNLYIRTILHPVNEGNACLSFRFINYHFGVDGGPTKSPPLSRGPNGKSLNLKVTAGTLRQKPSVVEIDDVSKNSKDWLTAKVQFKNLQSMFIIIFQFPTNFLQDNVYLAIDEILVTQGLCS